MRVNAIAFAVGLASAFALFGVFAATAGKAFGQIGVVAPISVAVLAIVMGLNLLGEVQLRFPSFGSNFDPRSLNLPPFLTSFVAGATFALAASPCATPVLSTLLAYVAASSSNVLSGGFLLFRTHWDIQRRYYSPRARLGTLKVSWECARKPPGSRRRADFCSSPADGTPC